MNIAGLDDNSIELYVSKNGKLRALYNGHTEDYVDMPMALREPFQAEFIQDKAAQQCIINEMHICDADEMEIKFVSCRHGHLDSHADLKNGKIGESMPMCDKLGTCPGFGIICKASEGPNGKLTRKEYLVLIEVVTGKLDKEIALKLGIEITTVRTYLNRLREKLCVNNRIEIMLWAQQKGIF